MAGEPATDTAVPEVKQWDQMAPKGTSEVEIDRLYSEILIPCWPDLVSSKVLHMMLSERESAEQYATILRFDPELRDLILKHANSLGLEKTIEDPAHAVTLLGIEVVRDIILGRGIYYNFYYNETQNPLPPAITEFPNYVKYAQKSQKLARIMKDPYPELAYAGGVIYDLLNGKMATLMVPQVEGLETPAEFLENVWKRGVRAGIAAVLLSEEVALAHKRFSFIAGLVHNIGKLVLYAYDPAGYTETLRYIKESKVESGNEELRRFGIDHAQAGSLYLGQLKFLGDLERAVDFHHDIWLCKFENVPIYHFAGLIYVAAHIVRLVKDKDTVLKDPKDEFFRTEEFLCLGLSLSQVIKLQKRYLKLRDFEQLVGMES